MTLQPAADYGCKPTFNVFNLSNFSGNPKRHLKPLNYPLNSLYLACSIATSSACPFCQIQHFALSEERLQVYSIGLRVDFLQQVSIAKFTSRVFIGPGAHHGPKQKAVVVASEIYGQLDYKQQFGLIYCLKSAKMSSHRL